MDSPLALRRKKNIKKGLQFCFAVVGASGSGRTTFVNTLCKQQVLRRSQTDHEIEFERSHEPRPVQVNPVFVELEEEGTRLALSVVDTPGFGHNIDNETAFNEILSYLEAQYDSILAEENRIRRNPRFKDNRVHALLYFIIPTSHGLRELDIELMKRLGNRVNIIPVIGKADTLTKEELAENKRLIMEDIKYHSIPIYDFPYDVEEDDEEVIQENSELRKLLPFAVVGSEDLHEINGRMVPARAYPWGVVDVEDPSISDFTALRSALFGTHLSELKEITHDFLYENYRTEKLSHQSDSLVEGNSLPTDIASQSVRLREEQLRQEEERLRLEELRVQKQIEQRKQELKARELQLQEMEMKIVNEGSIESPVAEVTVSEMS